MTRQQIFTKVKRHLLKQNSKCIGHRGDCLYLDPSTGRKCAVGCLIPKRLYRTSFECHGVDEVFDNSPALRKHIGAKNIPLLEELQDLHDQRQPSEWKTQLHELAIKWRLK